MVVLLVPFYTHRLEESAAENCNDLFYITMVMVMDTVNVANHGYGYGISCQSAFLYLSVLWDQIRQNEY